MPLPIPQVEFMVWDGDTQIIAGCSEATCFGHADGSDPNPGTHVVTHDRNNIGWSAAGWDGKQVYLYVNDKKTDQAQEGSLLVFVAKESGATSELRVMARNNDGVEGWSPTLTIRRA